MHADVDPPLTVVFCTADELSAPRRSHFFPGAYRPLFGAEEPTAFPRATDPSRSGSSIVHHIHDRSRVQPTAGSTRHFPIHQRPVASSFMALAIRTSPSARRTARAAAPRPDRVGDEPEVLDRASGGHGFADEGVL